jgi:hypothetical protein
MISSEKTQHLSCQSHDGERIAIFQTALYSDIDSLLLYAGVHSRHFGKYRLLSKRFPYGIYYDLRGDMILVRAVLDLRRDPSWITGKLNKLK